MIKNINTNMHIIEPGAQINQPHNGQVMPDNNTDVSVQVDNANLINMALQIPSPDDPDLDAIRQALLTGQLDSFKNCIEAAGNIYKFGI